MADVEVQMQFTTTERKVRKVKKTSKRRESTDNSDVTITEIEKENHITNDHGYVLVVGSPQQCEGNNCLTTRTEIHCWSLT
jgi:hypothetical protein